MRIVPSYQVDNTNLTASNVPETPPAVYAGGTTYADGDTASVLQADLFTYKVYESVVGSNTGNAVSDTAFWLYLGETYAAWDSGATYGLAYIVISTTTNHAYESLQAANTNHPLTDAAWWLDLGPTNRYKMYDLSNTSLTENGVSIDTTVTVDGRINSVAFLNLTAATLQVIMTTVEEGEVYNETVSLISSDDVHNWWEYFFLPIRRYGDWTFLDLPTHLNPTVQIIISDPAGTAKVGSVIYGLSREIGRAVHPLSIGIQDYSRKEADDFGNFTIVERGFAKLARIKVHTETNRIDSITEILADLRAQPSLFVGVENYRASWIYGFYKDWDWQEVGPNESYLTFELEGLT